MYVYTLNDRSLMFDNCKTIRLVYHANGIDL